MMHETPFHSLQPQKRIARATLCLGLFLASFAPIVAQETEPTTPNREKPVLVVLGDSLAAGYGVERSEAFPARLQQRIDARGWNYKVVNAGVSGDTSAGGKQRVAWLLNQRVDILLIELGGNDGLRGIAPGATRANLQAIIDQARKTKPGLPIVISGMQMPPNLGEDYRRKFRTIFVELAEANDALLVPHLLEDVGGIPELNQPDRIHPTPEGHRVIADNIWAVLEPLLRDMVETAG